MRFVFYKSRFSVGQAVNKIEDWLEEEEVLDAVICIQPPTEEGHESEQDSDNDDQPSSLNHLSSRQLAADTEVHVHIRTQNNQDFWLDHEDEEILPQPLQPQTPMYHYHERKWKQIQFIPCTTNKSTDQNKKVYESIDRDTEFF